MRPGLLAIAIAALLGPAQRDETALAAAPALHVPDPRQMVLSKVADGRFYVVGRVNGIPVRFLVDPDASDVALNPTDARRLGVDLARLKYDTHFETATGTGHGAAFTVDSLQIGPERIERLRIWINETPMSASLLGLNFLRGLESYQVRGSRLYLRWR